ncbi:nitric oxide reductase activation protein NorD [Nocardia bovistercoris]|uniref:VWA domain-containing protein n=1 Tax=Nocardia bovistercoris TaxID=2785916 RepID=A0A931N2R0_9NOCA|nr:VWA domain-containing protein [Nocardia bovistercoris]MBH0776316.1 VWA domain-containing protein [Nocardia bovistercoris]
MLASAIAGRPLKVARLEPGEPAWTDGATIHLDIDSGHALVSLSVQASLLAGGGLDPGIVGGLGRHPRVAARYLAIEGRRSLLANAVVPTSVAATVGRAELSVDSPREALALARGREPVALAPESFGVIRPRALLEAADRARAAAASGAHSPRRISDRESVDPLDESVGDEQPDIFSSPVGGGGALGKLLRRMLSAARGAGGNGPPGADSVTHRMRGGVVGAGTVVSSASDEDSDQRRDAQTTGTTYPEWDTHRQRYRPAWCTVQEVEPPTGAAGAMAASSGRQLRDVLSRLALGLGRYHRQANGDDLDLDAVVAARVDAAAGATADDRLYLDSLRRRRDLCVLVLLDISGSVAQPASNGHTIHEQQRTAAIALVTALYQLGDRVALYAFRSQGRSMVQVLPVKRFDEPFDTTTMHRASGLVPGAYSRLGAAIRHAGSVLRAKGGTPRKLLVVVSDGLAYDHGYERAYGSADARRALAEARRAGIGAVCVTVGAPTADDELRRVFGSAAHARIQTPDHLGRIIGSLFRAALHHTNR